VRKGTRYLVAAVAGVILQTVLLLVVSAVLSGVGGTSQVRVAWVSLVLIGTAVVSYVAAIGISDRLAVRYPPPARPRPRPLREARQDQPSGPGGLTSFEDVT
jgi:hypothetical protein